MENSDWTLYYSDEGYPYYFNAKTGEFVGTIRDERGRKIILNNLWGVAFGGGTTNNGAANELFVTVGQGIGTNELAGTFASIVFKP